MRDGRPRRSWSAEAEARRRRDAERMQACRWHAQCCRPPEPKKLWAHQRRSWTPLLQR